MNKSQSQPVLGQKKGIEGDGGGKNEFIEILKKILQPCIIHVSDQNAKRNIQKQGVKVETKLSSTMLNNAPGAFTPKEGGPDIQNELGDGSKMLRNLKSQSSQRPVTENFRPRKPNLYEWLAQASLQDKKGLRIIAAVFKHKGSKKFRTLKPEMKKELAGNSLK